MPCWIWWSDEYDVGGWRELNHSSLSNVLDEGPLVNVSSKGILPRSKNVERQSRIKIVYQAREAQAQEEADRLAKLVAPLYHYRFKLKLLMNVSFTFILIC